MSELIVDNKNRKPLPDILKGFAIILVIFGHVIQSGNGQVFLAESLFFSNKIYQFIYSFHMPLFALVAGYLALYSIKKLDGFKSRKERLIYVRNKSLTLFIPIIVWSLLEIIVAKLTDAVTSTPLNLGLDTIKWYGEKVLFGYWFLWAMIICFLIVVLVHSFLKDSVFVYIGIIIIGLFIPDAMNFQVYKFMFFYYVLSYLLAKYVDSKKMKYEAMEKGSVFILIGSGILFGLLFVFYNEASFVYLTGIRINRGTILDGLKQLSVDIYRYAIGLAGSLFFISFFTFISLKIKNYSFPVLRLFGRYTLGIYVLSGNLINWLLLPLTKNMEYSIVRSLLLTLCIAALSLGITWLIGRVKFLKKIIGK